MKVTAVYPRWHEEHNLITKIIDDVFGEGGDGWAWIQTSDPNKWATAIYNELLNTGWKKDVVHIVPHYKEECINVGIDQEGWTFSKNECSNPECYDVIYKIE